jgi:hypothetical protein
MKKIIVGLILMVSIIASMVASPVIAAGWLPGWANRLALTIDQTRVDANLTDFPLLVHLSASSGANSANLSALFTALTTDANRKKIAVTTADGLSQCYVEIEKWDAASRQAWLWVKVPSLSGSVDTALYVYYDAKQADNTAYVGDSGSAPAQNVWDSGYKAVYHLGDSGNTVIDSTRHAHHGTKIGGGPTAVAGRVGDAALFSGSNYISIPDSDDFTLRTSGHLIVSTWFSPAALVMSSSRSDGQIRFLSKSSANNHEWCMNYYNDGSERDQGIAFYFFNLDGGLGTGHYAAPYGSAENQIAVGGWEQISGRGDWASASFGGGTHSQWVSVYKNGTYRYGQNINNTATINPGNGSAPVTLGHSLAFDSWLKGRMDEVRIDAAARSDAWMKADYYSQTDGLVRFGAIETNGTVPPFASPISPPASDPVPAPDPVLPPADTSPPITYPPSAPVLAPGPVLTPEPIYSVPPSFVSAETSLGPAVSGQRTYFFENMTGTPGVFSAEFSTKTWDGLLSITFPQGIKGTTPEGWGLSYVSAYPIESDKADFPSPVKGSIVGKIYKLEPEGASFSPPATITMLYQEEAISQGLSEQDLVLGFWDVNIGQWTALKSCTVDTEANQVTAPLNHFGTFTLLGYLPETSPNTVAEENAAVVTDGKPVSQLPLEPFIPFIWFAPVWRS